MGLSDRPSDGEAETAAPAVTRAAGIDPVEAFEDLLELIRWDPGPAVGDRDLKMVAPCARRHGDLAAGVGVGDRVADEVAEHLRQAVGICLQGAIDGLQPKFALAEQGKIATQVLEELTQVDWPGLDQLPGLGTGECAAGPTAAAIGNALWHALGVRARDLPFTPERVARAMP